MYERTFTAANKEEYEEYLREPQEVLREPQEVLRETPSKKASKAESAHISVHLGMLLSTFNKGTLPEDV